MLGADDQGFLWLSFNYSIIVLYLHPYDPFLSHVAVNCHVCFDTTWRNVTHQQDETFLFTASMYLMEMCQITALLF